MVNMEYVKGSEAPAEVDVPTGLLDCWVAYDTDDHALMAWGPTEAEARAAARHFAA